MEETKEIGMLFREIERLISKVGINQAIEMLSIQNIKAIKFSEKERMVCDFIVEKTANRFNVKKEDLIYSRKRGRITEGRRMCFVLFKEHLHFSDTEIGYYFGDKSRQFIGQEINAVPLNKSVFLTKDETQFIENFKELSKLVFEYKNSL